MNFAAYVCEKRLFERASEKSGALFCFLFYPQNILGRRLDWIMIRLL